MGRSGAGTEALAVVGKVKRFHLLGGGCFVCECCATRMFVKGAVPLVSESVGLVSFPSE